MYMEAADRIIILLIRRFDLEFAQLSLLFYIIINTVRCSVFGSSLSDRAEG